MFRPNYTMESVARGLAAGLESGAVELPPSDPIEREILLLDEILSRLDNIRPHIRGVALALQSLAFLLFGLGTVVTIEVVGPGLTPQQLGIMTAGVIIGALGSYLVAWLPVVAQRPPRAGAKAEPPAAILPDEDRQVIERAADRIAPHARKVLERA